MYSLIVKEVNKLFETVSNREMRRNHKLRRKKQKVLILNDHLKTLIELRGVNNE